MKLNRLTTRRSCGLRKTPLARKIGNVGGLSFRAAVGDCARGLFGLGELLGVLSARPCAQPRVSLGRGRPAGHHRSAVPALLCLGALEWPRPDFEGAALRSDGLRRQPRRGREGMLLLSRFDADAFLHEGALQIPSGGISVYAAYRGKPPSRTWRDRVRADRHGVFDEDRYFDVFAEYAKASPNDILIRITVDNRGPDKATLHLLPTLWFRNTWSWGKIAKECTSKPSIELERDRLARARHEELGEYQFVLRRERDAAFHRERNKLRCASTVTANGQPYVKDAFHELRRARAGQRR